MTANERRQEFLKNLRIGMEPSCEKETRGRAKPRASDSNAAETDVNLHEELERKFDELFSKLCSENNDE